MAVSMELGVLFVGALQLRALLFEGIFSVSQSLCTYTYTYVRETCQRHLFISSFDKGG